MPSISSILTNFTSFAQLHMGNPGLYYNRYEKGKIKKMSGIFSKLLRNYNKGEI